MQRIVTIAISVAIAAAAFFAGSLLSGVVHTLIRVILPLPSVTVSGEDLITTATYLLGASIIIFGLVSLFNRAPVFKDARRTAIQIFAWGAAWGSGSLALFFMSASVFPHQLLVGAFLIGVLLFIIGYAVFGKDHTTPIFGRAFAVVGALFKLLLKPLSLLAILVTIAPLIAAFMYVKSQDFRDAVAEFRIQQNVSVDGDWMTVPVNTQTQLLQPIMIRMEPGNDSFLLVLERAGRLYRMGYPDNGTKELLIDFADQVGEVNLENGALGFDFDPRFGDGENDFVYLYFTSFTPDAQTNYLSRFDLSAGDADAILATQYDLMAIGRPPTQYHNAGHVEFGPDNMLYLAIGELDIADSHQTIDTTLAGGIFRIDVMNQGGEVSRPISRQPENGVTQGYSIPLDNPYADREDVLGEFFAHGLRNPFRFAFDPANASIWLGEVGSTVWEEVNVIESGKNYQFPYVEGRESTTVPKPDTVEGAEQGPVYTYRHTAYDRSVIGGIVYRGSRWPDLDGKYLFGDNYSGTFWAIPAVNEPTGTVETLGQATKYAQRGFTSLIQTPDDRILITVMGSSSSPNGAIVELVRKDAGSEASIGGGGAAAGVAEGTLSSAAIRESYITNCARCHGVDGYADGPDADMLEEAGARPGSFHSDEFASRSRDHVRTAIVGGGEAVGMSGLMPPWEGVLTDEEIDAITDYIMSMREEESED
ncbi:MAG: PQQ-dependent sugar dehydrogenase [Pseudomonadota bacterium]